MATKATHPRLSKAKGRMLLEHPFFATLLLSTPLEVGDEVPTAATDGKRIIFNPKFLDEYLSSVAEVQTVLAHEVMHNALFHSTRLGARNPMLWNMAADHAVNLTLKDQGFQFPSDGNYLCDEKYKGWSAERIYDDLRQQAQSKPRAGKGDQQDKGTWLEGDVLPTPGSGDPAQVAEAERAMKQRIAQAALTARLAGKLKGDLARLVDEVLDPKVPWQDVLRDYMLRVVQDDETWSRRNRRFSRVYLPTRHSEKMGEIVFIGDTSGSITDDELKQLGGEIMAVADQVKPERIRVIWADTKVASEQVFDEGEVVLLRPKGGGGTDMRVPLKHVEQYEPCVVILATDCYTPWPGEPDYPLIVLASTDAPCPIGSVIRMNG